MLDLGPLLLALAIAAAIVHVVSLHKLFNLVSGTPEQESFFRRNGRRPGHSLRSRFLLPWSPEFALIPLNRRAALALRYARLSAAFGTIFMLGILSLEVFKLLVAVLHGR